MKIMSIEPNGTSHALDGETGIRLCDGHIYDLALQRRMFSAVEVERITCPRCLEVLASRTEEALNASPARSWRA